MQNLTLLLSDTAFNHHRPTVIYITGWMMSPKAETSVQLIEAYLKYQNCNLIVLDWSDYSVGLYTAVMFRITKISHIVGKEVTKLFMKGMSDKKFHCVGHSFGGKLRNSSP